MFRVLLDNFYYLISLSQLKSSCMSSGSIFRVIFFSVNKWSDWIFICRLGLEIDICVIATCVFLWWLWYTVGVCWRGPSCRRRLRHQPLHMSMQHWLQSSTLKLVLHRLFALVPLLYWWFRCFLILPSLYYISLRPLHYISLCPNCLPLILCTTRGITFSACLSACMHTYVPGLRHFPTCLPLTSCWICSRVMFIMFSALLLFYFCKLYNTCER